MKRRNEENQERLRKANISRSLSRDLDPNTIQVMENREIRLEKYANQIRELEFNWGIVELMESELDELGVKNQTTRDYVISQVGLKILNLLLHAVKQRENISPVAISDLELDRNEERIKREVKKKALKELRAFCKKNHLKLRSREIFLSRESPEQDREIDDEPNHVSRLYERSQVPLHDVGVQIEDPRILVSKQISPMTTSRVPSNLGNIHKEKNLKSENSLLSQSITISTKNLKPIGTECDDQVDQNITLKDFDTGS